MLNKIIHVKLNGGQKQLEGQLQLPDDSNAGLCLFVHGSGSSRFSPRNRLVADHLYSNSIGFLLLDLLTPDEEREDNETRELRFDIPLLAKRVVAVIDALQEHSSTRDRPIALFGASTGAAAAIMAAYERPDPVNVLYPEAVDQTWCQHQF
ncbi:Alpha/Beta hydrolase protein [Syncephalis fuscata]|nr:Alpha/Beta hydrolase protein [Syncephalis fuscata]